MPTVTTHELQWDIFHKDSGPTPIDSHVLVIMLPNKSSIYNVYILLRPTLVKFLYQSVLTRRMYWALFVDN